MVTLKIINIIIYNHKEDSTLGQFSYKNRKKKNLGAQNKNQY